MEAMYGREYSEMLGLLSYQGLLDELEDFELHGAIEDTHLKLHLQGRDPDDGLSAIAYDKGYLFLRMLEEQIGRSGFDIFLKLYFTDNAFGVMTTEGFLEYLDAHLLGTYRGDKDELHINEWVYGPGLPSNCPSISSTRLAKIDQALNNYFLQANMDIDHIHTEDWSAHEYIYFVANLPSDLDAATMAVVDRKFAFTGSTNAEVLGKWFVMAARAQYAPAYQAMEQFLVRVGRRKFLSPIYKELAQTATGLEMARKIYEKAKPNYYAVSRGTIEGILYPGLAGGSNT